MKGENKLSVFLIVLALIIGFVEGIPLINKDMKKEFYVLIFVLLLGISFEVCSMFDIFTLKSLIEGVLDPVGKMLFK
jgi:hypothetical protein